MISEKLNNGNYKFTFSTSGFPVKPIFTEYKDKILYSKNKTIGFRKDKKISKFIGIRDGYSKQLEFTLVSVIIDGIDKVPKNRINFSSVSLVDNVVIHKLNNLNLYSEITDTNLKNMVEISDPFESLEIIYEVHTKGIKVSNRLSNDIYSISNNQYEFVDDGNNLPLFIIDEPVVRDSNGIEYNIITHKLYLDNDKLYYKKILGKTNNTICKFPLLIDINVRYDIDLDLNSVGVGVLTSSGSTWESALDGSEIVSMVHNSNIGSYDKSIGVSAEVDSYLISRTFLSYDTRQFSGYTGVLSSLKLQLDNFKYANQGVVVLKNTSTSDYLSTSDWNNVGDFYAYKTEITNRDSITEFKIPFSALNVSGLTKLVLVSYLNDWSGVTPEIGTSSYSGIDFSGTKLEVIYEPIKVYGQTFINVVKGDNFYINAFTNSGITDNIEWYRDPDYTELISIGSGFTGYSMEYQVDNKIYAVLPISFDPYYSDPLIVNVNVIELDYDTLPIKTIEYDEIDIDSIYFKFHKCFSGVCYTYMRDLNNVYEGFPLVSDAWGNESYNLYNEYDVIDEFFSNSHDVEVAMNENIDLTKTYNTLDGVSLYEGTRILLMNQTKVEELGVYVVQYDHTLVKTDEMNTYDDLFRYKAQVCDGTYADQEVHVWPILPPLESPYIGFDPNSVTFTYESGQTKSVTVLSNTSWTLYETIPWINVDTSYGEGTTIINITTIMKNTTLNTRTSTIQFTSLDNNVTSILTVNQSAENIEEILRVTTYGEYRETTQGDDRIINI